MGNRQAAGRKQHGEVPRAGALRQDLGMARVVQSRGPQSFLVQRRGDDAVGRAGQGQVNGPAKKIVGRPPGRRARPCPARPGSSPGRCPAGRGLSPASARFRRAVRRTRTLGRTAHQAQAPWQASRDRRRRPAGTSGNKSGQARAMISGPMPATSPRVKSSSGRVVMKIGTCRELSSSL